MKKMIGKCLMGIGVAIGVLLLFMIIATYTIPIGVFGGYNLFVEYLLRFAASPQYFATLFVEIVIAPVLLGLFLWKLSFKRTQRTKEGGKIK